MSRKRLFHSLTVLACAAFLLRPACAQLGGADLPDLSGLAGAIENATKDAPLVQAKPPAPGTLYHTGMAVPSLHPGESAKGFVRSLRETAERRKSPATAINAMKQLEANMPKMLSDFEAYMQKNGFAKRDMGVAYGVFFAENWKTATKQPLSDAAEANVVRTFSDYVASKYKAKVDATSPAEKEKTYETVLAGTMILSEFAQVYDKAGKTEMETSMRKGAKAMFTKVIGVDPADVDISLDGKISGSAPAAAPPASGTAPFVDSPNYTGPDPATQMPPATDTPPADAPAPMDSGKSGARALPPAQGVKPSQIAGVYAVQEVRIGVGGGFSQPFVPILALKDGTYTEDFSVPPSDLDAADSRRRHADDWGRWRYNAASSIGQWDGSAKHIQTLNKKGVWEATDWIGPLLGAKPGLRLSGVCKATGGGGSVSSGFAYGYQQVYTFFPNGRYEYGQSVAASSNDENGSVVGGSSTHPLKRGTYEIGNYALTLRGSDGTVKRMSYARTPDGLVFLEGSACTMDDARQAAVGR